MLSVLVGFFAAVSLGLGFMIWICIGLNRDLEEWKATWRTSTEQWREALDKEREAHSVTRERLYAAWKDGFAIPAPPEADPEPEMALPDQLAPIWEVWEGPGQAKMKTVLRQQIEQGRSVNSLLDEYGFLPPTE